VNIAIEEKNISLVIKESFKKEKTFFIIKKLLLQKKVAMEIPIFMI
jgi:hypothetical protein